MVVVHRKEKQDMSARDGTRKGQPGRRLTELSFVFAPTVQG